MCSFTYEEQGEKRYLVYEKSAADRMDMLTLEMMSNNRIDGLVPMSHTQIDDCFYLKYDITGLQSLRECFVKPVNRKKFFALVESILDGVMMAQEYMLTLSSYVLNPDYMYVNPSVTKVSMVALPILRREVPLERSLKELFFDVKYDSTEDCSYVAIFFNVLGSLEPFSPGALKEQVAQIKGRHADAGKRGAQQSQPVSQPSTPKDWRQPVVLPSPQDAGSSPKLPAEGANVQAQGKTRTGILGRGSALDAEKQRCMDILFSDEDEGIPKKEKKGLFFKKGKAEKPRKQETEEDGKKEKKGFWKKMKREPGTIPEMEALLCGIPIPGMDKPLQNQEEADPGGKKAMGADIVRQDAAIPAQKVALDREPVEIEYGGETVYLGVQDEETTYWMEENVEPEFLLIRCSTDESFPIKGTGVRIGRSPATTEICITGNKCIGRIHAILHVQGGEVFIEDNYSKNKTFVDGERLMPENPPCRLTPGARIRLGNEEFEFQIQE